MKLFVFLMLALFSVKTFCARGETLLPETSLKTKNFLDQDYLSDEELITLAEVALGEIETLFSNSTITQEEAEELREGVRLIVEKIRDERVLNAHTDGGGVSGCVSGAIKYGIAGGLFFGIKGLALGALYGCAVSSA